MRKLTTQYVFQRVYDMAALVEGCLENRESLGELEWDNPDIVATVTTFSKATILHHYIYAMIAVEHRYYYRKDADLFEEAPEMIIEVEDLLRAYDVSFLPYAQFEPPIPIDEATTREDYPFHRWFLSQDAAFELLWEKMTDEVFHLLFGNRSFLLKFNIGVANWIRNNHVQLPPEFRNDNGTIKRSFMPKWVRDAVFFRDHGRCVFCHVDLSGLLSLDQLDQFDHIVPLAAGGVNDPTNIQLVCEACNVTKGDRRSETGLRYPSWWPT